MITKTEAICIKNTRYGESSVISKMFTAECGLSSYIIQGVNRKSSPIRPSHLATGNILDLVIYQKPHASLQRIKELKINTPLLLVHTDMVKNAVLQFIIEIIAKTNEEHLKDEMIFNFLKETIIELETNTKQTGFVPLFFLCNYLKFSGWYPNLELWQEENTFNLREGRFEPRDISQAANELGVDQSKELFNILVSLSENKAPIISDNTNRRELFNALILYYEIHILKGKKIKSPAILAEVLS